MSVPEPSHRRLEEAALNAWPALEHLLFDGWVVRFANGYTRRANSVNPVYEGSLAPEEKIAACEGLYAGRGLPPIFRLTPLASPDLDGLLEARGYRRVDPSLVLYLDLGQPGEWERAAAPLQSAALDEWIGHYYELGGASLETRPAHREIIARIPGRRLLATLDGTFACGMGVLDGAYFGLFDIVTDRQRRRCGHGTALVAGMLAWARQHDARHAYLQVAGHNDAARRLYAKLGFREAYAYWYRIFDISSQTVCR